VEQRDKASHVFLPIASAAINPQTRTTGIEARTKKGFLIKELHSCSLEIPITTKSGIREKKCK
jgi:hypothetical protein